MKPHIKTMISLCIFSIAMGLLESSVVIYLRALYYQDEFTVAMKVIDEGILFTELLRELATLIMLAGIAAIAGKNMVQKFAYFLFCFAVWDIFYYVWLKVLIDWPASLFTWDILFLIPITWLGPVLAPLLCSVTMIIFSFILLNINRRRDEIIFTTNQWMLMLLGTALILYTFMYDYAKLIVDNHLLKEYSSLLRNKEFITISSIFIPTFYNWPLFLIGETLLILAIYLFWKRNKIFQII